MIIAFVNDLIYKSKIREAAKQFNTQVVFVDCAKDIPDEQCTTILVDLNFTKNDPIQIIKVAKEKTHAKIIAFCNHTNSEKIKSAKEANADVVLTNSQFFNNMGNYLSDSLKE